MYTGICGASRPQDRLALLALGRAWTLLGSGINQKLEKSSKKPQNPQRPVLALLGGFGLRQTPYDATFG